MQQAVNIVQKGTFIEECANRFLCRVRLDSGNDELCYVPSSARLSNFIQLQGEQVFLGENESHCRTRYKLMAVRQKTGNVILLNLNVVNALVGECLCENTHGKTILLNITTPQGYKSDVCVCGKGKEYYEIKSVLADNRCAIFPLVSGERAVRQLDMIKQLLAEHVKFTYALAVLNSRIKEIVLNEEKREYLQLFRECIAAGMKVRVYKLHWDEAMNPFFHENRALEKEFVETIERFVHE